MYDYKARVLKVVDGDTLHVEIDLGMDVRHRTTVRLYGINAPEMGAPGGIDARIFVADWMLANAHDSGNGEDWVRLTTIKDKREKYGRYLANVYPWQVGDGLSLNDSLLDLGHAQEYLP